MDVLRNVATYTIDMLKETILALNLLARNAGNIPSIDDVMNLPCGCIDDDLAESRAVKPRWQCLFGKDVLQEGTWAPQRNTNLQIYLNTANIMYSLGFSPLRTDGNYGPLTTAAVKAFQRRFGLTADGKAGKSTLPKLQFAVEGNRPDENCPDIN